MSKRIILAAAGLLALTTMYAQKKDTTKVVQLDEVIITANKMPQKQSTTGKVVTVISKEQIEKSSGKTVAQVLNEQAGVIVNGALNNMGNVQTVYMRGASSGRVLILIDGIPAYDPSTDNNQFDLNLVSLNNVESIEVCRGAQSTLYGSDAVGGVINIITVKKDIKKPFNISLTSAAGSYGTFKENLQLYGKAKQLSYTARYAKLYSNGFSSAYDSTGKGDFDTDGYNGDVASASLKFDISQDLSFRTFFQYSHYKTDADAGAFTDDKSFWINNENSAAGISAHFQKSIVNLTANYQYSKNKRNYYNSDYSGDFYGESQFVEIYSSIILSKNFTLLEGADHRFSSMNSLFVSSYGASPFADTSNGQSSLYSSLFFHVLKDRVNVELGGRLNVHSRYGSNSTYTFNPSFAINGHYRIFGSIATGFKAPTLFQLFDAFSGNSDLQPEKSKTYELGLQASCSITTTRVVFFNREIKNVIDFDNNSYKYFNSAKQTVNGLEVEITAKPTNKLTLTANYAYLHPVENTQSRISFKDSSYDYLLRRPAHNINMSVDYKLCKSFYFSVSGKYAGKRFDAGQYGMNDVQLDNYFLLSAYAEYKFGRNIKLFADAQNITNKKFFDIYGYNSIPFLLNGGVTLNW
jgi:vitamin B12 transporter